MAKYTFTQSQFDEISNLLKIRKYQSRDEQKSTQTKIRRKGFKISDHFTGFSDIDFKKLLDRGEIVIIDNPI
ncbi:MAG: hypothetical protein WBJ84_07750 [Bacteroidales bacterium]